MKFPTHRLLLKQKCTRRISLHDATQVTGSEKLTQEYPTQSYLSEVLSHDLYEEWHGVVHDSVLPRQFHDHIWSEEVIAGVETG